jgi:hypothetical protein
MSVPHDIPEQFHVRSVKPLDIRIPVQDETLHEQQHGTEPKRCLWCPFLFALDPVHFTHIAVVEREMLVDNAMEEACEYRFLC